MRTTNVKIGMKSGPDMDVLCVAKETIRRIVCSEDRLYVDLV
jgi:hypothetical protein